jgi:hypothetical protein
MNYSAISSMRMARIYADDGGLSHFSDGEVPLASFGLFPELPPFQMTRHAGANPVKLFATPAELRMANWHTTPEWQLAVSLNGWVEYETGDGVVRRFNPGEAVLVEDATGRGHFPDDWHLT